MGDPTAQAAKPARLVSLDAYRGFIMLILATEGFGLASAMTQNDPRGGPVWDGLRYQFAHTAWVGCSFWDLIQPSFMFMVGVAMPFSYASRRARGDSTGKLTVHALIRSIVLILLGIFLMSNWSSTHTEWTFVNVLTQIGLGYFFLYLLLGRPLWLQVLALAAMLGGYWLLFFLHPLPGPDFNYNNVGVPDNWQHFTGLAAHWDKNTNFASWVDARFLNWFPQDKDGFKFNEGGYQTLNFIPSMATMLLGLMAGEFLRTNRRPGTKFLVLTLAGVVCLVVGLAIDHTIWPDWLADGAQRAAEATGLAGQPFFEPGWTICPIVKRIWTPSWAIFSSGWTFLMLAGFFGVIDLAGYKRWTFPLVVVGINSIAVYCMGMLLKPWIKHHLQIHFGWVRDHLWPDVIGDHFTAFLWPHNPTLFEGPWQGILTGTCVGLVIWVIAWWMYRQKIFIRI
jgi:predicted acyltransferase